MVMFEEDEMFIEEQGEVGVLVKAHMLTLVEIGPANFLFETSSGYMCERVKSIFEFCCSRLKRHLDTSCRGDILMNRDQSFRNKGVCMKAFSV